MALLCEYCDCSDCQNGAIFLSHAQTIDGKWICDTCWHWDICSDKDLYPERKGKGPCEDQNCLHRPKLATDWITYENWLRSRGLLAFM